MTRALELKKYCLLEAKLVCKSGLKIGGTEAAMSIGGAENPVIKDPGGKPYIPGSSLKGKLRSILEYRYKKVDDRGNPCGCGRADCPVCFMFGPHRNTNHDLGPSRIIVRDAYLSDSSQKVWDDARKEGKEFTETKTETMINRRTGIAAGGSLRTQERVPAGTEFMLNINLRVFDNDDVINMKKLVEEALSYLQKDTLGGSGTRGYGWVEVKDLKWTDC
jgi:CRISPR-associated protein Csm3